MTSVLPLPVAEQYPSSTDKSSAGISTRSSGILLATLVGLCLCRRTAQHGPIDVRAELFAGDLALRGPLDGWATLGWDWPVAADPLIHHRRCYTQQIGQRPLATQGLGRLLDWVHAATLAGLTTIVNSRANSLIL